MENLASRIRRMREQRGFTQEYVAERLGISTKTYRQLECRDTNAARLLSVERLLLLAGTLDAQPVAFLSDHPESQEHILPPPPNSQHIDAEGPPDSQLLDRLHTALDDRSLLLRVVDRLTNRRAEE